VIDARMTTTVSADLLDGLRLPDRALELWNDHHR
jgi:hypothetical protein